MVAYSSILAIKEAVMQVMGEWEKYGYCQLYYKNISNWVDLVCIVCVFGLGIGLMIKDDSLHKPWLVNLVYIVVLIAWFQFWKDVMECLPFQSIRLNLNMWAKVAQSYVKIIAIICLVNPIFSSFPDVGCLVSSLFPSFPDVCWFQFSCIPSVPSV